MNLLGKIFTVCIFIASLFLMFVAMTVYATHKNWRTESEALRTQLQTAQAANTSLETKYLAQIEQIKAEHEAALQEVRKLESELDVVTRLNVQTQGEVDQLRAERREAEGYVAAAEENNNRLTDEVVKLRELIRVAQQARDEAFAKTLEATSDLHVTAGELTALRERAAQLISQLAKATSALRENDIDPDADVVARVRGVISATRSADGGQLIEITIGYDDGIRPGQTIEVFRGERYLGRAQILKADPDRAVGRVLREFQQGQIQEGDDVATKLRLG